MENASRAEFPFCLFSVADTVRQNVLASSSKKHVALLETLTGRQHKAVVAVLLMTRKRPEGIRLKELAARLNTTVPAASVLVESMVQNKIFIRVPSETDRRAVCIKISPLGNTLFEMMRERIQVYCNNLMEGIPEEDQEVFLRVLLRLHQKLYPEDE
ncbi:MAG: MarR family winged helix-turn-helix transcriptional regulator [Planctomycetia bacterium]|nr:MarR family winged helix-turn-helix transcriptional regulator [Planctomycetia bacterium]